MSAIEFLASHNINKDNYPDFIFMVQRIQNNRGNPVYSWSEGGEYCFKWANGSHAMIRIYPDGTKQPTIRCSLN